MGRDNCKRLKYIVYSNEVMLTNTSRYLCTQISSVVLDEGGELLQATDPNSDDSMLRIEFVGDSITAGFKVSASSASEPSTTANQDVHLAYPRRLADLFQTSGKILHMYSVCLY